MPLIEPDRVDHALDGAVQIRIVEDDEGRLTAEFERQRFAGAGRGGADRAADLGRARKGDFVDAGMIDERGPRASVPGDDVEHAVGQPCLLGELGEQQRGERGVLGRLEDDAVAERDRGRDFPSKHQQREIPRHDLADDAERRPPGELGVLKLRPSRVMQEMPGDEGHVDVARFADRLAVVERFEHGEQACVPLHHAGERIEMPRSHRAACGLPCRLRRACGLHGGMHVGRAALRDLRERFACRRCAHGELLARFARLPPAADEMAEPSVVPGEPRACGLIVLGGGRVIHCLKILGNAHRDLAHATG